MAVTMKAPRSRAERFILRRVRTSLNREVWSTRFDFLGLAWKEMFVLAAIPTAMGVALLLLPTGNPALRHIVAGGLFATAFWAVYCITAMRTYSVTVGSWAEAWTREQLRHRDLGWSVQDDLFLGGGNIDHVVVTQDEVLAVESKYRGLSKLPDLRRHASDIEQARRGASLIKKDLAARRLDVPKVVPVLVVWGPGAKDLERLAVPADVFVVAGQELGIWCRRRSNKRLVSLTQRKAIVDALAARRRDHDEWRAAQPT